MSVAEIYEERAAFSFEVFPPKTDVGMEKLCGTDGVLEKLYTLNPDYISWYLRRGRHERRQESRGA